MITQHSKCVTFGLLVQKLKPIKSEKREIKSNVKFMHLSKNKESPLESRHSNKK